MHNLKNVILSAVIVGFAGMSLSTYANTVTMTNDEVNTVYDSSKDLGIVGQDNNLNNVRDDVDDIIDETVIGNPLLKTELRRYAWALEQYMRAKTSRQIINYTYSMDAPRWCSIALGVSDDDYSQYAAVVFNQMINTTRRKLAVARVDTRLRSIGYSSKRIRPFSEYCEKGLI